jgi:hypothetical protein
MILFFENNSLRTHTSFLFRELILEQSIIFSPNHFQIVSCLVLRKTTQKKRRTLRIFSSHFFTDKKMVDNWTDWWCTKRWPTCPPNSFLFIDRDILISKEIKRQSLSACFSMTSQISQKTKTKTNKSRKKQNKNWSNRCQTRENIISTMPTGQEKFLLPLEMLTFCLFDLFLFSLSL